MKIREYVKDGLRTPEEYPHFIQWGFTHNPGKYPLQEVPKLWKHHDKFKIQTDDEIMVSLDGMIDLYRREHYGD